MRFRAGQTGFTLVELMIGIVILAILASVAVPSFQTWLLNSQVRNAAESIASGLQRARAEAVGRNIDVEFKLEDNSTWSVCAVSCVPGGETIETRSSNEGSKKVAITFTPAGNTKVTYNNFGGLKPANSDGSAPFNQVDVDSSELPASESQELRITIGLGGNVRMCDPNVPSSNPRGC